MDRTAFALNGDPSDSILPVCLHVLLLAWLALLRVQSHISWMLSDVKVYALAVSILGQVSHGRLQVQFLR